MTRKTFLLVASALLAGSAAPAQEAGTVPPDTLGTVRQIEEAASVTARRELVRADADKLTYDVSADPQAAGSNLIDLLRRVPMLSVNGEEQVLLNGSKDYKVLVNGRSTGMLARNFNQLARSVPASSVQEIQVITNPPVKYDAEGIGGIINIVMAKRLKAGYSGSLGAQAGTLGSASGDAYLSAQLGRLALGANASGMHFPNPTLHGVTDIENYVSDSRRFQRLSFDDEVLYSVGAFSLEASYEPDSLNLVTLSGWANLQRSLETFDIVETFCDAARNKTLELREPTRRNSWDNTFSGELAYQHTFRGNGGVLTFSYAIDGNPNRADNNVVAVPVLGGTDYHRHSSNTARTLQQTGQLDYFATLREKHQVEAGAKYTLRAHTADSQDELWDFAAERWTLDNSNVNDLDYRQHIFAAYASYGYKFAKLTLKAGARLEYTLNRGVSKSAAGNLTFDNENFNVVPYFNAAWQIGGKRSLALSYTRRLGRPGVYYLNPYVSEESPFSRMHGNPDLRTVVSDALTLTYRTGGEKWNLMARAYGSLCGNGIEYLSAVDADGVKVSTYGNAVRSRRASALLSFDWAPSGRVDLQASGEIGYARLEAPSLGQRNDGVSWSLDLSADVGLWQGATAFCSAGASVGEITLQRTYLGVEYYDVAGLRQAFLQSRLILTLSAVMPFQTRYENGASDTRTATYRQHNSSWYNPSQLRLGLTWRFGKTDVPLRHARKNDVSDKL